MGKYSADAERGKVFTKIGREIATVRDGGSDPTVNGKFRDVIAKAKSQQYAERKTSSAHRESGG